MDHHVGTSRAYDIYPYDPEWPRKFEIFAEQIRAIFAADVLEIEHIGSTSVPGMQGKPIIDILVVVADEERLEAHREQMEKADYWYQGEVVMGGSRLYRLMSEQRILANVHIFPKGHVHINEMLRLRDYLRTHPEDVQEYSYLKKRLKEKYPNNYPEYRKQKDEYFDNVLKKRVRSAL